MVLPLLVDLFHCSLTVLSLHIQYLTGLEHVPEKYYWDKLHEMGERRVGYDRNHKNIQLTPKKKQQFS